MHEVARRRWSLQRVLLFFLALVGVGWGIAEWGAGLPADIHLMLGRELGYRLRWPVEVSLTAGREQSVLQVARTDSSHPLLAGAGGGQRDRLVLSPLREGRTSLRVRLFGVIPLRQRQVTVLPALEVVPGGQAIGVLVAAQGMVVTGFSPVPVAGGRTEEPARRAGVRVGDLVTAVDGRPVYTAAQLGVLVNARGGRPVTLEIRREGRKLRLPVTPARAAGEEGSGWRKDRKGEWRLGVFVEDPTAGVGTLSFWDPRTRVYAALGHMITDGFSQRGVTLNDGRIIPAVIAGVQPGRRGQPGEKIGLFHHSQGVMGTIERNTHCGIFGRILRAPEGAANQRLPVATRDEVEPGPAEILTVVRQQRVERFAIAIVRVRRTGRDPAKSLVIQVTDPHLLSETGGIIQGMSGSPILQHGRLAGVVTHVFVNDPTRGYGILAESMAWEGGLFTGPDQEKKGESLAS